MLNNFPYSVAIGVMIAVSFILYRRGIINNFIKKYKKLDPNLVTLDSLIFILSPFLFFRINLFLTSNNLDFLKLDEFLKPIIPLFIFILGMKFQKRREVKNDKAISYALFDDLIINSCIINANKYKNSNQSNDNKESYLNLTIFDKIDELYLKTWLENRVDFYREHQYINEVLSDGSIVKSGGVIVTEKGSNNTKQLIANTFNFLINHNSQIVKLNNLIDKYNFLIDQLKQNNEFEIISAYRNAKNNQERILILNKCQLNSENIVRKHEEMSLLFNDINGNLRYIQGLADTEISLIDQSMKELSDFIHQ